MGAMKILDQTGDTQIEWDPSDKKQTEEAKSKFKELKDQGYEFFEVAHTKGKQVKRWSKNLGKLIAAPGAAKSTAQKQGGRAMAGGPNALVGSRGLGDVPAGMVDAAREFARR
jgi:predicted HAD superfamily phosphohydrolase YqeG